MRIAICVALILFGLATSVWGEDPNWYRASWILTTPGTYNLRVRDDATGSNGLAYFHGKVTIYNLSSNLKTVAMFQLCYPDTAFLVVVPRQGVASDSPVCDSLVLTVAQGETVFVYAQAPVKSYCDVGGQPCPVK